MVAALPDYGLALHSYPPENWGATGVAALLGLLIGCFLNIVVQRLPQMIHMAVQDSGSDPEPGYALARERHAYCGIDYGPRYLAVVLASGIVAGWLVWHFGSGAAGAAALVFGFALIALGAIDAETGLLPDDITLPLLWCGLLVNLRGLFVPLADAVLGAAAGYLALWLIYQAYRLATGKEAIGYGDFKLLAALGAWIGWMMLPLALLLASIAGVLVGLGLKLAGRSHPGDMLPFGPYLAAAAVFVLMYGPVLLKTYLL